MAGEIPSSPMFQTCSKPCLMTLPQLREAPKRNQAILAATKSCGNKEIDAQLLAETREEVRLGGREAPSAVCLRCAVTAFSACARLQDAEDR